MNIDPGWYRDQIRKGRRRYWDGHQWGPPKLTAGSVVRRVLAITGGSLGGLLVLLIIVGLLLPTQPGSPTVAVVPATPARTPRSTAPSPSISPTSAEPSPSATQSSTTPSPTVPSTTPAPRPSSDAKPKPRPTPKPKAGTALAAATGLTVKGRAPKTGYSRSVFGSAWGDVDGNGCRQREDVLNRDLTDKRFNGCKVLTGTLVDPYTGDSIRLRRGETSSAEVQIDHVVALSDAWQKGAQQWTAARRLAFANDTLNLLAVGRSVNASKSDGDTATWLPPKKSFRCHYVARQVAVKKSYGLWVTAAERAAMVRVLATCPSVKLPSRQAIPPHPAPKPKIKKSTPPAADPAPQDDQQSSTDTSGSSDTGSESDDAGSSGGGLVVHPGAFCSPVGATGVTTKGTSMVCSSKAGDQARWRSRG